MIVKVFFLINPSYFLVQKPDYNLSGNSFKELVFIHNKLRN